MLATNVLALVAGKDRVLDCTLGGGGHSFAMLESGTVGSVIGIDRDPDAVTAARDRLAAFEATGRFQALLGNYADLESIPELDGQRFGGILLDLGVSSHQIDAEDRGFTFREGAPLDMRMGPDAHTDAAIWLNTADEGQLASAFREYGDEPRAMRLAREVARRRSTKEFRVSDDLVGAIRGALGPRTGAPDFARLFQAVRIAVNDELSGLTRALPALRDRLRPSGALVIIAYHSGEDRLVKDSFREWSAACICPPRLPMCACRGAPLGTTLTRRPIMAGPDEITRNPRARSARLRAWQNAASAA